MEHGNVPTEQRRHDQLIESIECGSDVGGLPVVEKPPKPVVNEPTVASAVIVSLGMVSALHFFIYMCFLHPDVANGLVGLVFLPLLKALIDMIRGIKK